MEPLAKNNRARSSAGLIEVSETALRPHGLHAKARARNGISVFEPAASEQVHRAAGEQEDSLFERFAWLYIFYRERVFRDDTDRMIHALWPYTKPVSHTRLIELGCGPGFYSCGLAERFRELSVIGVDRSTRQLEWAKEKARSLKLDNCHFERDNVLDLSHAERTFDVLIASRLFTVLPDGERAVAEMHRVLKPGGRCFIAEPRHAFWASLPLYAMWLLAGFTSFQNGYREPANAKVLAPRDFESLFAHQPWRQIKIWQDGRYQYALCEKS